MRITLAQLNYVIGDFEQNTAKILQAIQEAKSAEADLVVFAELSISGYPPRDFLDFEEFISRCEASAQHIAKACTDIACIIGLPILNPGKGKKLFNAAYFIVDGKVKQVVRKSLLPNYDVFDEYRYFEPNREHAVIEYKGERIALTICEDLWNTEDTLLYVSSPMDELIQQQPTLMINIAASPFAVGHAEHREQVLSENAKKYQLPIFYVNHVGAHTELIFDGGSMVLNQQGSIVQQWPSFEESIQTIELASGISITRPKKVEAIEQIHQALVVGIRDYFSKSGFQKAILGMSGGIDSAVVFALAVEALGKENVLPVLMPSEFSSDHSISDSLEMVQLLGTKHEIIPIKDIFSSYQDTLQPQFKDLPFSLAEENLQARIRGALLMAMSNKFGYILLNTSNKSELAVGYGTLYGDMCGGLSVIGDVYKTQVYELARHLNKDGVILPVSIIEKAPSAELRPNQKDSDSLPEYDELDAILRLYVDEFNSPNEIVQLGYPEAMVRRVAKLVNTNEYKRYQAPPVLRVSSKAFGPGRRLPIVARYW